MKFNLLAKFYVAKMDKIDKMEYVYLSIIFLKKPLGFLYKVGFLKMAELSVSENDHGPNIRDRNILMMAQMSCGRNGLWPNWFWPKYPWPRCPCPKRLPVYWYNLSSNRTGTTFLFSQLHRIKRHIVCFLLKLGKNAVRPITQLKH